MDRRILRKQGGEMIWDFLSSLFWFLLIIFVYFLPSIAGSKKKNAGAIFILNLFLGWTFIGWIIALIWATMKD